MSQSKVEARAYFSPKPMSAYERAILIADGSGIDGVLEAVFAMESDINEGRIINPATAQNWCNELLRAADVIFPRS